MRTLAQACKPRDSIFDKARRDTVLDLTDLAQARIGPAAFFEENHTTEGMRILLTEGFRRLEGKTTQGVFKLTQAMGGGKTHNLIALGLLARHPEYRKRVMEDFYTPGDIGPVRVVAFSGRESDASLGIWGAIAEQLGKKEQFNNYYSPLSAPGQTAWVNLLQGGPLVIVLDELPPYFQYAKSKTIGNSDLSVVTATALSNVSGGTKGLTIPEIIANLCAPERDISKLKNEVVNRLVTTAWYLHAGRDGRLFLKNVQNLVARLCTTAESYLHDQSLKELRDRLAELFKPANGWCYQTVQALPAVDEINVTQDRTVLVIANPHGEGPHPDLQKLYDNVDFKNRLCFLTGQRNPDALLNAAKELKAIRHIIDELIAEGTPDNDPQLIQAHDLFDRIQNQFGSALRETFSTLYYPTAQRLMSADFPMEFTANRYDGEDQVIRTLKGKMKYTEEVTGETFVKKVEARLFTQKAMLWSEIKRRAATNPAWQWHRPDALDKLKDDCLHKDIWRQEGSYVEKGPFPQPATEVKLQELDRDDETGTAKLRATPINGDTIFVEIGGTATTASRKLSGRDYETDEMEVSFLAVDSTGGHKTGQPVTWHNRITLQHRVFDAGNDKMAELRAAPQAAMRYTTDGSDPKVAGGTYDAPFVIPEGTRYILAVAEEKGVYSDVLQAPVSWDKPPEQKPLDPAKPATWRPRKGFTLNATRAAYGFMERLRKHGGEAAVTRLAVLDGQWVDLTLADDLYLEPDRIQQTVEQLRALVGEGEVNVEAAAVRFATGRQLQDYVRELAVELPRDEVEQD